MERYRLIVIDQQRSVRLLVRAALEGTQYEIVDEADSPESAVVSIARAKELGANVIVVGGEPQHGQPADSFTEQVLGILADARATDPEYRPAVLLISGMLSQF